MNAKSSQRLKKKEKKNVVNGVVHICATFNNTIVTITDLNGNTVAWSSAGQHGFKGPKKSTPYAAQITAEHVVKTAQEHGLRSVYVVVKGLGNGRESAFRALSVAGLNVTSIIDATPVVHNGCRPPKKRRT
jgi:small subunit ribosomal protein S11